MKLNFGNGFSTEYRCVDTIGFEALYCEYSRFWLIMVCYEKHNFKSKVKSQESKMKRPLTFDFSLLT
jgi:hypothetical protein